MGFPIAFSPPTAGLQKALAFESRQSREHFAVRRRLHQLQNAQAKQGQLRWGCRNTWSSVGLGQLLRWGCSGIHTRWCPPSYVCWFIIPMNYRYKSHEPYILDLWTNLADYGAPSCSGFHGEKPLVSICFNGRHLERLQIQLAQEEIREPMLIFMDLTMTPRRILMSIPIFSDDDLILGGSHGLWLVHTQQMWKIQERPGLYIYMYIYTHIYIYT